MHRKRLCAVILAIAVLLCGCGGAAPEQPKLEMRRAAPVTSPALTSVPKGTVSILESGFHSGEARGANGVLLDLSAVQDGYVAVSAVSEKRLKFQVKIGEETYTYNLAGDGTPSVFPLSCGDGEYRFRVMENVTDSKYAELYSDSCAVTLRDEFQPFLRPSDYVPYDAESLCVARAAELAAAAGSEAELIGAIYGYICKNVRYDREKAAAVTAGYLPDPDATMQSGLGICFDYASLAAAMLRSQGIPTRVIFGYVSPNDVYHAWNMFYSAEQGWVTVSFEIRENDWTRMDATFAANGADDSFIGDGGNYSDVYCY